MSQPQIIPGIDRDFAAGLAQKLIIVRTYLMVAWAGSSAQIKRIIAEIDANLPPDGETLEDPEPVFRALNSCNDGVEIVALLIWRDKIHPFCIGTRGFPLDDKRIYLLGTGAADFFSFLQENPSLVPSFETADGLLARATLLRFAARSMKMQLAMGIGLENSWGGGFEIAYPTRRGFEKLDRLLVRAWYLPNRGEMQYSDSSFFIRYIGKDLYISRFNPDEKTYVVKSLVAEPALVLAAETITPSWTLDIFLLETGQFIETARFHPLHSPVADFIEFSNGELLGWSWDREYVHALAEKAREMASSGRFFASHRY
jgi:hypothetical protein